MVKKDVRLSDSTVGQLRKELQETALALHCAYDRFNFVSDPELVESSVYEISSLKAKYNYLLRRVKELEETLPSCAAAAWKGGPPCQS